MDSGIAFALGAMVFFGLGDLVYKRAATAGVKAHHFLMVQSWGFAASVALYGALTGTQRFVSGSLWGALAGCFMFTGFYNFARSLHGGSISINAPVPFGGSLERLNTSSEVEVQFRGAARSREGDQQALTHHCRHANMPANQDVRTWGTAAGAVNSRLRSLGMTIHATR